MHFNDASVSHDWLDMHVVAFDGEWDDSNGDEIRRPCSIPLTTESAIRACASCCLAGVMAVRVCIHPTSPYGDAILPRRRAVAVRLGGRDHIVNGHNRCVGEWYVSALSEQKPTARAMAVAGDTWQMLAGGGVLEWWFNVERSTLLYDGQRILK